MPPGAVFGERQDGAAPVVLPVSCGVVVALLTAALLARLLFVGQALSYDAVLYVRSLWGVAHLDFHNPVADWPILTIHAQLVLLVLAPFARAFGSAEVLIAAQALALGATVALAVGSCLRSAGGGRRASLAIALACTFLFSLGAPLVANAFLFDVRPDVLGVPFATAGLLSALHRGAVDRRCVAFLLASVLAREEFALVAAASLVSTPQSRPELGLSRRTRVALALACVAYVAAYYVLQGAWSSGSKAMHLSGSGGELVQTFQHRAALLLVLAATSGALVVRGARHLGSVIPGLGLVLLSRWLPEWQFSLHYNAFMAPGLVVAACAGFRSYVRGPHRALASAAHLALGGASYLLASAFPGGAFFAAEYFDVKPPVLAPASYLSRTAWMADVHAALRDIPVSRKLMVPYAFGTPVAARPLVQVVEHSARALVERRGPSDAIDTVALLQQDFALVGRALRQQHGFEPEAISRANLVVLSRAKDRRPVRAYGAARPCQLELRWDSVGLGVCNLFRAQDGRIAAVVMRSAEVPATGSGSPTLRVRAAALRSSDAGWVPLHVLDGAVRLGDLPSSVPLLARTDPSFVTADVELCLTDDAGQELPMSYPASGRTRMVVRLATSRVASSEGAISAR